MKTVFKWMARVVALLLVVVVCAAFWMNRKSGQLLGRTMAIPLPSITLTSDAATIARGEHLVNAVVGCADCHGEDLGGRVFIDNPAMGHIETPNLTRGKGGIGASASDAQLARSIRHSVGHDGRQLMIMPAWPYLSEEDLNAVLAYVRSRPPVDREHPAVAPGPVAKMLMATGVAPFFMSDEIDHKAVPLTPSAPAPTAEYGRYMTQVAGCAHCHGPTFSGGKMADGDPSWPPAANLTPTGLAANYDEAKFMQTLRTGVRPSGVKLSDAMPFRMTKYMTDDELKDLVEYVKSL